MVGPFRIPGALLRFLLRFRVEKQNEMRELRCSRASLSAILGGAQVRLRRWCNRFERRVQRYMPCGDQVLRWERLLE
jgi:hypothetical protein